MKRFLAASETTGYSRVPETVSPDWAIYFETLPDPAGLPLLPAPGDLGAWRERNGLSETQRLSAGFGDPGPGVVVVESRSAESRCSTSDLKPWSRMAERCSTPVAAAMWPSPPDPRSATPPGWLGRRVFVSSGVPLRNWDRQVRI